jgi:DNA-binding GntR family transcriptional regulator
MSELRLARTISSQLVERLRMRIVDGVYSPGMPLLQDALAAEFEVSKIPVREALIQLQAEGLIETHAHRGFLVRPISSTELQELFRLRALIEPTAVALGASLATQADRALALDVFERLTTALQKRDSVRVGLLNQDFHLALIAPAAQPITAETLQRIHVCCRRYVALHVEPANRTRRAIAEHGAILDAWTASRPRELQKLTRQHIEATLADLLETVPAALGGEKQ